jgi:rare lipoprotein A
LTSLTPSSVDAAPVARITLKAVPDGPTSDDAPAGDEKYQLTGEAARQFERGHASWYGPRFHGRLTASGERYDMYALTAAHKTLPFGTVVRVRSNVLGREVDVRINDRGPFAPGRVIDVSRAAAEALGLVDAGVAEVSLLLPYPTAGEVEPLPAVRKARRITRRAAAVKRR